MHFGIQFGVNDFRTGRRDMYGLIPSFVCLTTVFTRTELEFYYEVPPLLIEYCPLYFKIKALAVIVSFCLVLTITTRLGLGSLTLPCTVRQLIWYEKSDKVFVKGFIIIWWIF